MPREQEDEIILRISPSSKVYAEIRENGSTTGKNITVGDALRSLQSSIMAGKFSTGLLPPNALSLDIDYASNTYFMVLDIPLSYVDIQYEKTVYGMFPVPRYVFGFTVGMESQQIQRVNLGVTAMGKLSPESPMYKYPFSNVYENSKVCLGGNTMPRIKSKQQLENMPYYILRLPDGDDLYSKSHNRLGMDHRQLLEHLKDKSPEYYYSDILVPDNGKTFDDFIKRRYE